MKNLKKSAKKDDVLMVHKRTIKSNENTNDTLAKNSDADGKNNARKDYDETNFGPGYTSGNDVESFGYAHDEKGKRLDKDRKLSQEGKEIKEPEQVKKMELRKMPESRGAEKSKHRNDESVQPIHNVEHRTKTHNGARYQGSRREHGNKK